MVESKSSLTLRGSSMVPFEACLEQTKETEAHSVVCSAELREEGSAFSALHTIHAEHELIHISHSPSREYRRAGRL